MTYKVNPYAKALRDVTETPSVMHMEPLSIVITRVPTPSTEPVIYIAKPIQGRSPTLTEVFYAQKYGIVLMSAYVYTEITAILDDNMFDLRYSKQALRSMVFHIYVERAKRLGDELVLEEIDDDDERVSRHYTHTVRSQRDYLPLTKRDMATDRIPNYIRTLNKSVSATC